MDTGGQTLQKIKHFIWQLPVITVNLNTVNLGSKPYI